MNDEEMTGGRVRRARTVIAAGLGLVLLGALPLVSSVLGNEPEPELGATGGTGGIVELGEEPLHGRLAYLALDPERPDHVRVWVWDLETATVTEGPALPLEYHPSFTVAHELYAAGPRRQWLVLLRHGGPRTDAYVLRGLEPSAEAVRVARGYGVTVASDGRSLLVLDAGPGRSSAPNPPVRLLRVDLATGEERNAFNGQLPPGAPLGLAMVSSTPVVGFTERDRRSVISYALRPPDPELIVRGAYPFAAAGANVFFRDEVSRAGTFVWPGAGAPRPVVPGSEVLGRVLAISDHQGRQLALAGTVDGVSGLWILDVSAGTVQIDNELLPSISNTLGVAFDDSGTAFVVGREGIVVSTGESVGMLPLPLDAPEPRGAVVWLP